MQSTTMSAPIAHAFDPQKWLTDFETVGGGYVVTPDGEVHLGFAMDWTTFEQQLAARAMISQFAAPENPNRAALFDYLREKEYPASWRHAKARLEAAARRSDKACVAYNGLEDALYPFWSAPECEIEYTINLGVLNGVDVGSVKTKKTLSIYDYNYPDPAFAELPAYLEWRKAVEQQKAERAKVEAEIGAEEIEREWKDATGAHPDAWRAAATAPVFSLAEVIDKLDTLRASEVRDCDGHMDLLLAALSQDLARIQSMGA